MKDSKIDSELINNIESLMDSLKVIEYDEEDVESNTSFLKFKVGYYKLNNGETIRRESVVRQVGSANATAIFAITKEKKILLVIQPRTPLPTPRKIDIELPAGYIEKGESEAEAARRELLEETGYVPDNVVIIDGYYPSLGYSGEKISIVLATNCQKVSTQNLDEDEYVHYIGVSIKEFKYLLDNNYILDATARLAYYRTLEYLQNNSLLEIVGGE